MVFLIAAFLLGIIERLRMRTNQLDRFDPSKLMTFGLGRVAGLTALGALAGQLGLWFIEAAYLIGWGRYVFFIPCTILALAALALPLRLFRKKSDRFEPEWSKKLTGHLLDAESAGGLFLRGAFSVLHPNILVLAVFILGFTTWEVRQGAIAMACFGFGGLPILTAQQAFPAVFGPKTVRTAAAVGCILGLFVSSIFGAGAFGFDLLSGRTIGDDFEHAGHAQSADEATIGLNEPAPIVSLTDLSGKVHKLSDYKGKTVVLVTVGTRCPCVEAYRSRLNELAKTYGEKGVIFLGFNPNADEPPTEIRNRQQARPFIFPISVDTGHAVADTLGSMCMTETYLIDSKGFLRYHGRIDDNTYHPDRVTHRSLQLALDAVLAGQPISDGCRPALGCAIVRK
jgi:peroxiredoxin/sulfite exporter TauE/SafE